MIVSTDSSTIFINQSDNINIISKLGHTIHLPCLIYKKNDQTNVNKDLFQRERERLINFKFQFIFLG